MTIDEILAGESKNMEFKIYTKQWKISNQFYAR